MSLITGRGHGLVGVALVALGLAACEEEPPLPQAAEAGGGQAGEKPAVDDKIASAMAAAEARARAEAGSPSGQAAPPSNGILGAEAAARELPPGAPAQLVLGGAGSSPRLRLDPERLSAGGELPVGKLVLSYRTGGSVMPTVELELQPKLAAADATGQAPGLSLRFALGGARPSQDQPGRLPENAQAEIAKLNGSSVAFALAANGARAGRSQELAGKSADLEPLVTGAAEVLSTMLLLYPEEPVGAGAFWMVKSRETANGADVLAYRMVKLTELSPERAQLTVETRRYLIEPRLATPGLPPHQVRRFESDGQATLSLVPGALLPASAELRDGFAALATTAERPNQAMPIQAELTARVSFGG